MIRKMFGWKLVFLISTATVCATAWCIYNDYQAKEDQRIREQAIQKAQKEEAERFADFYVASVNRSKPKFTPPPVSSFVDGSSPRPDNDAILQEMRRANDLTEQANRIAEDAAFHERMKDITPEPIVIQPDPRTQFQNQQALDQNEQAIDELRRMREIQEQEQLRRNLGIK